MVIWPRGGRTNRPGPSAPEAPVPPRGDWRLSIPSSRSHAPRFMAALPPYLGGKRRLVPLILALLAGVLPRAAWPATTLLDAFSGGGAPRSRLRSTASMWWHPTWPNAPPPSAAPSSPTAPRACGTTTSSASSSSPWVSIHGSRVSTSRLHCGTGRMAGPGTGAGQSPRGASA